MKTPTAILTSDWHLRDSQPPCRTDDFEATQWRKVDFISSLANEHDIPVYHAGDLFHHWKPSPYLLSKTMGHLPQRFYTIYGNHDLPQHSLELKHKTGVFTLEQAQKISVLKGCHWRQEPSPKHCLSFRNGRTVLFMHVMTYQGKLPYPGCTDIPSRGLLKKYSFADLILTGHNHQSFYEESEGRLLVNPGGITRQESDESNKHPKVYLWYADDNTIEVVDIPIVSGVVTAVETSIKSQEREERINAFISKLNTEWDSTIDFEKNIDLFLAKNPTEPEVTSIILKAMGR